MHLVPIHHCPILLPPSPHPVVEEPTHLHFEAHPEGTVLFLGHGVAEVLQQGNHNQLQHGRLVAVTRHMHRHMYPHVLETSRAAQCVAAAPK